MKAILLRMNKYVWILSSLAMLFVGCKLVDTSPGIKTYSYPPPVINSFSPKSGYPHSMVTIKGKDFGDYAKAVTVFFDGTAADSIVSVEDSVIKVLSATNGTTGPLTVKVWTHRDSTKDVYTFMTPPKINEVSPLNGAPGDQVTITGSGFGTDASKIQITFNGTAGTVTSVTNNEINVTLPSSFTSGPVVLSINGYSITGPGFTLGKKLTGTIIGTDGSWGDDPATTKEAAMDGDLSTFFDAPTSKAWVGLDFGADSSAVVLEVRYAPRSDYADRMLGGVFEGANTADFSDADTLYTITNAPPYGVLTSKSISNNKKYRYLRYYSEHSANASEIQFQGYKTTN